MIRFVRRGAVGALLVSAAVAGGVAPATEELELVTVDSLVKLRGDRPLPRSRPVDLGAARNEFEAFQLAVRAPTVELAGVDVEAEDLVGEGGARIEARHVTVYLQRFLELARPSSEEGEAGEWPDPLVPRVDAYAGERRDAFPFRVAPGRHQPLWIEVYVPLATPPGSYRGALRVSVDGELRARVPWTLEVWPFALPSTSSYQTSFGFSGLLALRQHRGGYTDEVDLAALTRLYAGAALRHRISIHGGTMAPPPARFRDGVAELDWKAYDAEVAPLLDGELFGDDDPLPGARATSIDVRTPGGLTEAQTVATWRAWAEHFRTRGWYDRMFLYVWDEPTPQQYPLVAHRSRLARQAGVPVLLTEQFAAELDGLVDRWVPLVNCFDAGGADTCGGTPMPRVAYEDAERRGARLWWYQSCASHGCNIVGGAPFRGWPSYVVDAPAVAHRILPWLAWTYGVAGELYFNTVEAWAGGDPWQDIYRHGGHGDGTLFYPGTPAAIGGRRDVPIESLRLKVIRDGLEDYEYLALLAGGDDADAKARAAALAPRLQRWNRDPAALHRARDEIARELARKAQGSGG